MPINQFTKEEFEQQTQISWDLRKRGQAPAETEPTSLSQLATKKKTEAMKPSKEKAQPDQALRNFPVPLTEVQVDEVVSCAREKLQEAFAMRFGTALLPPLRPRPNLRMEAEKVRKTAKEQRKLSDQVEPEEPEGEPSKVEITMDTSEMDTTFRVEPGDLPTALSQGEPACCNHLFAIEHDEVAWSFAMLRYLNGANVGHKKTARRDEQLDQWANAFRDCGPIWELKVCSPHQKRRTWCLTQTTPSRTG